MTYGYPVHTTPVPSDRFHDLCTTEWSKDTPQLQVDYHMFHRNYEIKVMQNQQVQKRNAKKRLKMKDQLDKVQKKSLLDLKCMKKQKSTD